MKRLALLLPALIACGQPSSPPEASLVAPVPTPQALPEPSTTAQTPPEAEPHPAPIDCPLRAAGHAHDPTAAHPFEDTGAYIAFLERPDRDSWQRPDAVLKALALRGDERVVDLGAGSGYFTFRFASALPTGQVEALDVQPDMVRHIHHTVMTEGIENITARLVPTDAPRFSPEADLVFVSDVLHHVPAPDTWLKTVADQMKAGARLALIEFSEGPLPEGPPEDAKVPKARLLELAKAAGLNLDADHGGALPYQELLIFSRAP